MNTTLPTVALVYDFDGTLAPGNMQKSLDSCKQSVITILLNFGICVIR